MVDLESSVLVVVVPSGDWLTVFSFDLTVPSPLSLVLLVLETSLSHPTSINDNAKADIATHITAIRFIIFRFIEVIYAIRWIFAMGGIPHMPNRLRRPV